ncbi:MAG TPA: BMP family ABC transporter substrate-binding protein [Streptosporangiaceae bacterium]|nr:BMP family ABC transporter substrate-binding protein [Streptosporangiaceae bacterium]
MRGKFGIVAGISAVSLLAAACGSSSSSTSPSTSASSSAPAAAGKFKACMVTDTGGINDKSFNQSSYAGVLAAAKANSNITPSYLQSTSTSDYAANISAFLAQKCGIIVTVGFLMGGATQTAAKANPSQKFAIVDFSYSPALNNVDALLFNTLQDGFLGGYLAAGMTKTGKVATFGGQKLSTVTIYMDGFYDGVQYYNKKHHKSVTVLGWNEKTQNGSFTNSFTNLTAGQQIANTFITEGADIIFPVAGGVGLGAAKAVQTADKAGGHVNMMWVDVDGCISAATYCPYFITSVEKGITTAVKTAVLAAAGGTFKGGNYIGTLSNGGVGLAPYHDFASKVPAALQAELATIKTDIENGTIKPATKSPV